jgi:quinohemoprotein ethanol dehydrogenase
MRFARICSIAVVATVATMAFSAVAFGANIPLAPVFQPSDLAGPAGADWATNGGDYGQTRYSTLNGVSTANVSSLKEKWHIHLNGSGTGSKYKGEGTPLEYKGIMYAVTGNSDVFALDATTGTILWQYNSLIPQFMNTVCCNWDQRGLALGEGRVYVAQLDGTLVALDQTSGGILWAARNGRWQDGYTMTMAPLYYNGLVIVGVSGSEYGARGSMTAYNAKTGKRVWRFYNTPTPGDIGSGTWPNNTEWMHGGATVWNQPTVDIKTGFIVYTTANADPWASRGPGDDLFTSSMVALDAMTGDYEWHFQAVHHDIWDYDCPSNTVMFNQVINGTSTPVVAEPCKTGWVYEINRTNGNPATQIDEKPVAQNAFNNTSTTQPIPAGDAFADQCSNKAQYPDLAADGKPFIIGCIWQPFDDQQFAATAPGAGGGNNWNPASYNPNTGFLYVCSKNTTNAYKSIPNASATYVGGRTFIGLQFGAGAPGVLSSGDFVAMNMSTNKIAWKQHYTKGPVTATDTTTSAGCDSGSVTTAGGLVFMGLPENAYKGIAAYDAATGTELWRSPTDAGIEAPPMTYSVNGQQYVAVYAGGRTTTLGAAVKGDSLYAYTLGGT